MFVVSDLPRNGWWPVYEQHGMYLLTVCMGRSEQSAVRIAQLLNMHGMEPCDIGDLADALLDLEERNEKQGG